VHLAGEFIDQIPRRRDREVLEPLLEAKRMSDDAQALGRLGLRPWLLEWTRERMVRRGRRFESVRGLCKTAALDAFFGSTCRSSRLRWGVEPFGAVSLLARSAPPAAS
jgi:hypothetical protein